MMIGIDFGTTNSGAAIYTPQGAQMIETVEGNDTMPSAVAQTETGFVTGQTALRQLSENPDFTFKAVKRFLGVDYHADEHGDFQLAEGPDGKVWWKGRDGLVPGTVLVAEVLKSILRAAEFRLGKRPTGAVIAVPVDYRDPQRKAIEEAARLAGLEQVRLFEEPFCAALSYGYGHEGFANIAVYDLGGGTFDITILSMKDGAMNVRGMNGIGFLGGTDFDRRLTDYCVDRFFQDEGEDLKAKPHCMVHLTKKAEDTKIALSGHEKARVYLENFVVAGDGIKSMNYPVSREDFEQMTKDLIKRTISAVDDALKQADMTERDIHHIVLVGGQSRMPLIHKVLAKKFGAHKLAIGQKPEFAVALGAALHAAEIEGRIKPSVLQRIAPSTISVCRFGGAAYAVLPKGSAYPFSKSVELRPAGEDQTTMCVEIVQGEALAAEENTLLTRHVLSIEAGSDATVSLRIEADQNGQLTILVDDQVVYGMREAA
jgi:molecular chaperone DnaK